MKQAEKQKRETRLKLYACAEISLVIALLGMALAAALWEMP